MPHLVLIIGVNTGPGQGFGDLQGIDKNGVLWYSCLSKMVISNSPYKGEFFSSPSPANNHMNRNLLKNKPFSAKKVEFKPKIAFAIAVLAVLYTSLFPSNANAAKLAMADVIWAQSWVPEEFVGVLPVAKERPKRVMYVTVTAYSSTPDQTDDTPFIAATGKRVHDGMVAANFLRFGTRVRFPDNFGDKNFFVEDRMHERFSDRMDIWMETREEALKFGLRRIKVEIY